MSITEVEEEADVFNLDELLARLPDSLPVLVDDSDDSIAENTPEHRTHSDDIGEPAPQEQPP